MRANNHVCKDLSIEACMTLLTHQRQFGHQPEVHALVIGVGDYRHLEGGNRRKLVPTGGMGQLDSPPISAAKFCRWLINDMRPQGRVLGSVDVLCSGPAHFVDADGHQVTPDRATMRQVKKAAARWYAAAKSHPDNLAIFYFCGHGVSSGDVHSLLLEDFGADQLDPFNSGAIDAEAFMDGLRQNDARSQLFLLDACRTVDHQSFGHLGAQRGTPIISGAAHANLGTIHQAALWATALGLQAYGRTVQESLFMEAMLASMNGAGSMQDVNDGSWVIQPDMLKRGIDFLIQRTYGTQVQYATLDRLVQGFAVHVLPGNPVVPVKVSCRPANKTDETELRCSSGDIRLAGPSHPWHLDLPHSSYTFEAVSGLRGVVDTKSSHTAPPWTVVALDV